MNVAILGPQGSGKGTQAQSLAEKNGWNRIETGRILREMAESNGSQAEAIKDLMLEGKLVPDTVLAGVIEAKLKDIEAGNIVFDGTPRNVAQYVLIKKILGDRDTNLDKIVFLKIPKEETLRRLTNRRTCDRCNKIYNLLTNPPKNPDRCECGGNLYQREDDTETAISKRLAEYEKETIPVLNMARAEGILTEVDGTKQINDISKEIEQVLGINKYE